MYFSTQLNPRTFFSSSYTDLALESNPSDHPRASTIFLSKSQTDGKKIFSSEKKIDTCFCFVYYRKYLEDLVHRFTCFTSSCIHLSYFNGR